MAMPTPKISVAICTWNRADSLRETLSGLSSLVVPKGLSWELLVVNNNSTDQTERVIEDFKERLPLRAIFEPKPGLSNARNAAVDNVRGEFVLWTDDDVTVDPHWLDVHFDAFERFPDAVVFGGRVVPRFEGGILPWVSEAWPLVRGAFAERELGPEIARLPVDGDQWPFGANFAVRMADQVRHRYDPDLGYSRGALVGGEELRVMSALLGEGKKGYWLPGSLVYHRIEPFRQTIAYIRKFFVGQGLMQAKLGASEQPGTGCPRWLYRQWLQAEVRWRFARMTAPPLRWVGGCREASKLLGRIQSCRRARR